MKKFLTPPLFLLIIWLAFLVFSGVLNYDKMGATKGVVTIVIMVGVPFFLGVWTNKSLHPVGAPEKRITNIFMNTVNKSFWTFLSLFSCFLFGISFADELKKTMGIALLKDPMFPFAMVSAMGTFYCAYLIIDILINVLPLPKSKKEIPGDLK